MAYVMERPMQSRALGREESFPRPVRGGPDDFTIRRAVERLREGLFDPVAVRLLTAHEERLRGEILRALQVLDGGESPHLCIVGAYGQGKSHSLVYVQDLALREGFATSLINLDPREVPFHNFRGVYRELLAHLRFPDSDGPFPVRWKRWAQEKMTGPHNQGGGLPDLLPGDMPHLFKAVLTAMAHGNASLSEREKRMKKHAAYRPREFPMLLVRALGGEAVPVGQLRKVFQYRQVPFYREGSLSCRGVEPYLRMLQALSGLIRQMGCRGWVILFDEGESIAQASVSVRSKSYRLLHRLFTSDNSEPGFLCPVFAFTDDFFQRVSQEDYNQVMVRREMEVPYFERDYAQEWQNLNIYRLLDLSRVEWEELAQKLIRLHAMAYGWMPPEARLAQAMANRLDAAHNQETRLKLKSLVDCLDLAHQEQILTRDI
jgi:hypothetical protein